MHSVSHFLVQVRKEDPPEDRFNSAVIDFLAYAERYHDEDNWFRYIDLICEDGVHTPPHNVGVEKLSTRWAPEPELTWEQSVRKALADQLHMITRSLELLEDETPEQAMYRAHQFLIRRAMETEPTDWHHTVALENAAIVSGLLQTDSKIFAVDESPYRSAAHDLTYRSDNGVLAILRVDIHT